MKQKLDNFNFFSLHAFLTAGSDERNLLAFFQALEAVSLDGFEVYEPVSYTHLTLPTTPYV